MSTRQTTSPDAGSVDAVETAVDAARESTTRAGGAGIPGPRPESPVAPVPPGPVTMAKALNAALADALAADAGVVVFGEDVGTLGGVFRITDGLAARFGTERCFDTPLAESGIAGMSVGMAINGMRPVIEMQFDAFAYPAFEQIASHVAKMRNRTRGAVAMPIVIRIPYAGGIGGVEHHCDSSEAYYAHTPGLKVVTPATVTDAYLLLRAAIDSDDPVIFMEPKKLYFAKDRVDLDALKEQYESGDGPRAALESGGAAVARTGTDATLIAYGPSLPTAMAAAAAAQEEGRSLEVVDVRTIVPFDDATVAASVAKTSRAVVITEETGFASVAAEITARVQQRCFHSLAAPVLRVTGFDIPYPAPKLEHHFLPSVDRILDAVDDLQWED
ncbi:putative pyruvate dehydrogenase E1 component, beta subunit [Citricoccus zhacaiensis]|uniref:3-methyl-2-oxobutanoate dehydrogenase (2-methylpropanoyl-transferring) n=1 Tax=Citricoccus zhacaiensis TaxID=489142 RepID=A0ABQ2LW14_9MICC|nr:transketolase C-terminal domain-containing protein [Citricoccus zhacaiensis]GGO43869.1 putative pyruvate dehydrogenase E1 component, beta subunit [Citricoccus zhacaiensis]